MTLLDRLLQQFPDTPKTRAKQWIAAGRVTINGQPHRHPNHPVPDTAIIELRDRQSTSLPCPRQIHPQLQLLHLDTALAVVNKPAGLLSLPTEETDYSAQKLLADFLRTAAPASYRRLAPLPVHRLDQYTSGIFCMAMNPDARANLIEQVKTHTMRREYIAYVEGRLTKPTGTWRHWLKLSEDERTQTVFTRPSPDATEAVTHYELLAQYRIAAKLRLKLETGLRHQIRIQAAHAGFPLIGDRTYNPRYRGRFGRQALHADFLELQHPERAARMSWRAPLPPDLLELESFLSKTNKPECLT
jgi:23S rRNA pseudouridine1911/1915/1917 synthase